MTVGPFIHRRFLKINHLLLPTTNELVLFHFTLSSLSPVYISFVNPRPDFTFSYSDAYELLLSKYSVLADRYFDIPIYVVSIRNNARMYLLNPKSPSSSTEADSEES